MNIVKKSDEGRVTSWLPLTRHPKLSRTNGRVEEEVILPLTHVAGDTPNSSNVTSAGRIPKTRVLRGLDPKHIGKMADRWLEHARLHKGNVGRHYDTVRIRCKLKRDHIIELEDVIDKRMKGKGDPCLQDRLAEGHITDRREM